MNSELVRGAIGMASLNVRAADTSVAQAINDLAILATPTLINIFEGACSAALAEHVESGETTITTEITVKSHAPVGVGTEIHALATCIGIVDKSVVFAVEVHAGNKLIATGEVTRKFVDRVSFGARVAAETMINESARIN